METQNFTGLYFGSFNPVHNGHLMIANHLLLSPGLQEIWFVISPQNPLKKRDSLLADYHRLELAEKAVSGDDRLAVSDIEFRLSKPSFTVDTMAHLSERQPGKQFALIMGADNLYTLHKWKNAETLLSRYPVVVYPRPGARAPENPRWKEVVSSARIIEAEAPLMEISSSYIREQIKAGNDVRHFLPPAVWKYIRDMHFYE